MIYEGAREKLTLGFLRHETFGELGAFAEEKLVQLLFHDFQRLRIEGIQTVLIHDHLGMLNPELPGFLGDVVIDTLTELALPRYAVEPFHLSAKFDALYHARSGLRRRGLGLVCHVANSFFAGFLRSVAAKTL